MLAFVPPDRDPSDMYIHRVKAISRDGGETVVVTQGDANPGPDPWTPFVISDANAWVVVFKVSHVGTMAGTLREFIGSSGMLASGGVIILVGCVLVLIWHPSRGRRQATASDDARSGVS